MTQAQNGYTALPKNAHAVTTARSWLRALQIPVTASSAAGCDLSVKTTCGESLQVAIVTDDQTLPDVDCLVLWAKEMGSYDRAVALEAFHVLTEEAGYGTPLPVDRGVDPTRKEVYGQDVFLQAARHREFRSAPDMPKAKYEQYGAIVKRACRGFFGRNARFCGAHGYDGDDLNTLGWIWTTIFVHRYEIAIPTHKNDDDNARLLTKFLHDRFVEFHTLLIKQGRNTLPSRDVVQIALLGRVFDENEAPPVTDSPDDEKPAEAGVDRTEREEKAAMTRRRAAARTMLTANLAKMPHETMVARLTECAENTDRDYAVRKEARKMLIAHVRDCAHCKEAGTSVKPLAGRSLRREEVGSRGEKDVAGPDPSSDAEDAQDGPE